MTRMRQTIAKRLVVVYSMLFTLYKKSSSLLTINIYHCRFSECSLKDSQNTACMLTTFNEIDMSNIMNVRNKYKVDISSVFTPYCVDISLMFAIFSFARMNLQRSTKLRLASCLLSWRSAKIYACCLSWGVNFYDMFYIFFCSLWISLLRALLSNGYYIILYYYSSVISIFYFILWYLYFILFHFYLFLLFIYFIYFIYCIVFYLFYSNIILNYGMNIITNLTANIMLCIIP